jgi:anti-sigma factor RsiW
LLNKHPLEVYSSYLDGHCLSDAEVKALRSWIAADERNASEFVEFAVLHAAITDRLMLGRLLEDLASHRSTAGITPALLADAIREIESNSPRAFVELPRPTPEPEPEQPLRW